MPSRRYIVKHNLNRYDVAKNIPQILDELSFREVSTQLDAWKLFDRRGRPNEFAGIYEGKKGNKEFLVEGPYSNLDIPKRDLETIDKRVFREGYISRTMRKGFFIPAFTVPFGIVVGVTTYDMITKGQIFEGFDKYMKALLPNIEEPGLKAAVLLVFGSIVAGGLCNSAAGEILNKYYGSKLSKEAENYLYGEDAEKMLEADFIFENIKSGKLKKEDFLKRMMETASE
jgi:hypothetical protein